MVFITLKILSGTVWRIEQALFPAVVAVVVDDVCSFWLVVVVDINLVDINSTPLRRGDWFDILRGDTGNCRAAHFSNGKAVG